VHLRFEDHAGFQRATLVAAVACSALAGAGALVGSAFFGPSAAVLAAATATLALALCHVRLTGDAAEEALARAADVTDAEGRALLGRAARARTAMSAALARAGAGSPGEARAVAAAGERAVIALSDLLRRRAELARQIDRALPDDAVAELAALEARRDAAPEGELRDTYGRAVASLVERGARARTLIGVVERIDARLAAAVAELEGTSFAVATRAALAPGDPPAALAAACDRLRAASADLGAESEALAELAWA
jgi:hypothetical protein